MGDKLYSKDEVQNALDVVVDVTLDRVRRALQDETFGHVIGRDEETDKPIVQQVIEWADVEKVIEELRNQEDEDD